MSDKSRVFLGFNVGFSGVAYRGLQLQTHAPTHHTVEGVFILALRAAGLVEAVANGRIMDHGAEFGRACRTDRGVHAVRNVLTARVLRRVVDEACGGTAAGVRALVNAHLPPTVRVLAVTVLQPAFDPRQMCSRRVYRYLVPLYALLDARCDSWAQFAAAHADALADALAAADGGAAHIDLADGDDAAPPAEGGEPAWRRATRAALRRANDDVLPRFVGSKRFHNFTVDPESRGGLSVNTKAVSPLSDEAVRTVYRCELAPRVVLVDRRRAAGATLLQHPGVDARFAAPAGAAATAAPAVLPFVVFQVEGASFLLNMIRKMVGAALAVLRGARPGLLDEALQPGVRMRVPLAPGPYLMLAASFYSGYDARIRRPPDAGADAGALRAPEPLSASWVAQGADDAAAAFLASVVYADVAACDVGAVPPLDALLAARDTARAADPALAALDAAADAHVAAMKEYRPAAAAAAALQPPAVTEMTAFLRLLRMHNWAVRAVPVPEASKAANQQRNATVGSKRDRAASDRAAAAAAAAAAGGEAPADAAEAPLVPRVTGTSAAAAAQDDGWVYAGDEAAQRAASRRYCGRRAFGRKVLRGAGAAAVGAAAAAGADSGDDDDVPSEGGGDE